MKIEYDSKDLSFKEYNIAQGIASFKKIYIKNKESKIKGYIRRFIEYGLLFFAFYILLWILGLKLEFTILFFMAKFSFVMAIFCVFFSIFSIIGNYFSFIKNKYSEGIIIIDNKGINDEAKNNLSISFKWEGINLIIVYKDLLVVIGNSPLFILAKLKNVQKAKKEILKYCSEEKCVFY